MLTYARDYLFKKALASDIHTYLYCLKGIFFHYILYIILYILYFALYLYKILKDWIDKRKKWV